MIHSNGDTMDGFADIVVLNYEVLDRARAAGPDAFGELQHVLRALRALVLDEVCLVDDHAAEAEVTDPASRGL